MRMKAVFQVNKAYSEQENLDHQGKQQQQQPCKQQEVKYRRAAMHKIKKSRQPGRMTQV